MNGWMKIPAAWWRSYASACVALVAPAALPGPLAGALPVATAASAFHVKRRCADDGNAKWAPKAEYISIRNALFNTGLSPAPYPRRFARAAARLGAP